MDIRAAEISDIIRKQIENYDKKVSVTETGTVLTAGDGIARVYGLSGALAGELLEFEGAGGEKVQGMVLNLEEDNVGVALLGKFEAIREGDTVKPHRPHRRGRRSARSCSAASSTRSACRSTAARPIAGAKQAPGRDQGARHHRSASRSTSRCRPA